MKPLKIKKARTFFEVDVKMGTQEASIIQSFTSRHLADYDYDRRQRRMIRRCTYSYFEKNKLRLPICFLDGFVNFTKGFDICSYVNDYPIQIPNDIYKYEF
jgi:hypothetical protein